MNDPPTSSVVSARGDDCASCVWLGLPGAPIEPGDDRDPYMSKVGGRPVR